MSDLTTLRRIFEKAHIRSPMSDWKVDSGHLEHDDDPNLDHVLVIGCPDGNGGYLQCQFDERGNILQATVIQLNGYECSCKWCKRETKCQYCGRGVDE